MRPLFSHSVLSDIIRRHFEMYVSIQNSASPNPDGINVYIRAEDVSLQQQSLTLLDGRPVGRIAYQDGRQREESFHLLQSTCQLSLCSHTTVHVAVCILLSHYLPHSSCKSFPPPSRLHKYLVSYLLILKVGR
jgi:hypothetical protein